MEFDGGKKDVVDPEVRAYVSSLVSAVSCSNSDVISSDLTRGDSLVEMAQTRMAGMF